MVRLANDAFVGQLGALFGACQASGSVFINAKRGEQARRCCSIVRRARAQRGPHAAAPHRGDDGPLA